ARRLVRARNEALGIRHAIRMRNARRVLGNAAIVGERCDRFSVLEARGAQGKPLGLEDGDTRLAKALAWDLFQQGHGSRAPGSRRCGLAPALKKRRGAAGHPSPPLEAAKSPAGSTLR